jgi:hypothetical protein
MYIVYDPASGMILQTISGPGKEYGTEQLDPRNLTWLWLEGAMNVDPTKNYIDVATKLLCPMTAMSIAADKITFAADSADEAKVTGIPLGSNVVVFCDGVPVSQHIIHDGEIEVSAAAPATYEVQVTCWKFLPARLSVTAIDPALMPKPETTRAALTANAMTISPDVLAMLPAPEKPKRKRKRAAKAVETVIVQD